jgi:hypothetical protein
MRSVRKERVHCIIQLMFLINNCLGYHTFLLFCINNIGCSFKFLLKVGVEESIENVPGINEHGSAV